MLEQTIESDSEKAILEVKGLKVQFLGSKKRLFSKRNVIKAVDGVSFQVNKGETFSIVGESGCGKSTTGFSLLRIVNPAAGEVIFDGENITSKSNSQFKKIRKDLQMIFQDPYSSLNPKLTVQKIIEEPLRIHNVYKGEKFKKRVFELMELVGINTEYATRYPHEFSGGQRQRIGIARALALNPKVIICDEAVSALDVSIQSQILNLLDDLQEKLGLTYIFISHDLSVVEHISDKVAVMYLGRIVEIGDKEEIFDNPKHPYTRALISSIPTTNKQIHEERERIHLEGDVPSAENPPTGCYFHPRCPFRFDKCEQIYPEKTILENGQEVSCHLYEEKTNKGDKLYEIVY